MLFALPLTHSLTLSAHSSSDVHWANGRSRLCVVNVIIQSDKFCCAIEPKDRTGWVGQGPRRNVNPSFSPDHHLRAAAIAAPARDRALSLSITAPPDRNLTFDIDMYLRAPPSVESKKTSHS